MNKMLTVPKKLAFSDSKRSEKTRRLMLDSPLLQTRVGTLNWSSSLKKEARGEKEGLSSVILLS